MSENKENLYEIVVKDERFFVIEEKILNYKTGPDIIGYALKTDYGKCWFSKEQFNLIFEKRKELLF